MYQEVPFPVDDCGHQESEIVCCNDKVEEYVEQGYAVAIGTGS